jgi:hypothetical protein
VISEFYKIRPVCSLGDYELRKDDCAPKLVFSGEDKEGQPAEALLRGTINGGNGAKRFRI